MGNWVDWLAYVNSKKLSTSQGTSTGTFIIPEVAIEDTEYDPCNPNVIAVSPQDTPSITMSSGGGGGGGGTSTIGTPPEVVDDTEQASVIALRPTKTSLELIGCNDVSTDYGANDVERHDSYYVDRDGASWILDGYLDEAVAGYVSGMSGNTFMCFGGMVRGEDGWEVSNRVMKYNIITKNCTTENSPITGRFAPTGGLINGWLYVYGGFDVNEQPATFKQEMHRVSTSGTWVQNIGVPMNRVYNGMVIDGTILRMAHCSNPHEDNYWGYDGACYEYQTAGGNWTAPYNGADYAPVQYISSQSFAFHKGVHYHHEEGKMLQVISSQFITTNGVTLPSMFDDPMMCSYGNYILFYSRGTWENDSQQADIRWFDTKTRLYGTLDVVGDKPSPSTHFDMYVIDDYLYVFGGGYADKLSAISEVYDTVWKLNLLEFFDNIDDCGATPVPPDTLREKTVSACKEYAGHPCGANGTYVRSYNDPDSPDYRP